MLYKAFYNENKQIIDKISEKIVEIYKKNEKIKNQRLLEKMEDKLKDEILNKQPAYLEQHVIYEIYQNSYDPRAGKTLAVYIPADFERSFVLQTCQELFGEFTIRDKKGCKESNYREYSENDLDLIFKEAIDYKTTLNLIFSNYHTLQPLASPYYNDIEKYRKFLSKAQDVIY